MVALMGHIRYMNRRELVHRNRQEILRITKEYGAVHVQLFGSVARNEDTSESDIDILVDFEPGRGLLNQFALQRKLSELLNCRVEVVSRNGLKPRIKDHVLQEAVSI